MAAPVLRGRGNAALASAADDGGGMIDSIGGGDGELMAAPVLRGRGNAALAAADDDDNMRYSIGCKSAATSSRSSSLGRSRGRIRYRPNRTDTSSDRCEQEGHASADEGKSGLGGGRQTSCWSKPKPAAAERARRQLRP